MSLLTCYNRGCGQRFIGEDNHSTACQHHPGSPVFHEGLKGWTCCSKRTSNFSDFLEFPGCEKGLHNPVKPDPPEKPAQEEVPDILPVSQSESRVAMPKPAPRPTSPVVLVPLIAKIDPSLMEQLELTRQSKTESSEEQKQSCQNGNCKAQKKNGEVDDSNCVYHSGSAIFHEGLKFWSCCQKKTTDFEEFLKLTGCSMGTHKWVAGIKPVSSSQIRFDHFQKGRNVVITFYGKLCDYTVCSVKASSTNLQISLLFVGNKSFEKLFDLYSGIIPDKSTVEYLKTKVEVCLVKDEVFHWPSLEIPVEDTGATPEQTFEDKETI